MIKYAQIFYLYLICERDILVVMQQNLKNV